MSKEFPLKGTRHERFAFRDLQALEEKLRRLGLDIPMSDDLSPLFLPLSVGSKTLPNRLAALPM